MTEQSSENPVGETSPKIESSAFLPVRKPSGSSRMLNSRIAFGTGRSPTSSASSSSTTATSSSTSSTTSSVSSDIPSITTDLESNSGGWNSSGNFGNRSFTPVRRPSGGYSIQGQRLMVGTRDDYRKRLDSKRSSISLALLKKKGVISFEDLAAVEAASAGGSKTGTGNGDDSGSHNKLSSESGEYRDLPVDWMGFEEVFNICGEKVLPFPNDDMNIVRFWRKPRTSRAKSMLRRYFGISGDIMNVESDVTLSPSPGLPEKGTAEFEDLEPMVQDFLKTQLCPWTSLSRKNLLSPEKLDSRFDLKASNLFLPRRINQVERSLSQRKMHQPTTAFADEANMTLPAREALIKQSLMPDEPLCIEAKIKKVKFSLYEFEPLFLVLCLYDSLEKKKVSEEIHLSLNDQNVLSYLKRPHLLQGSQEGVFRRIIFEVPEPNPNICCLLRVYRVFRGDPEKELLAYGRYKGQKLPQMDQLKHDYAEIASRDQRVDFPPLQLFAWQAFRLFDVAAGDRLSLMRLMRLDCLYPARPNLTLESMFEATANDKEVRKLKLIPAAVEIDWNIGDPNEIRYFTVDCSLFPLLPLPDNKEDNREQAQALQYLTKEAFSFVSPLRASLDYQNLMFVFPENLVIKFPAKSNIQISCQLVDVIGGEQSISTKGDIRQSHSMYGPCYQYPYTSCYNTGWSSLDPHSLLLGECFSSVCWGEKKPTFTEEFKVELPADLKSSHCLLFTIYNINGLVANAKEYRTILGYGFFFLYEEGFSSGGGSQQRYIVRSGHYTIPIFSKMSDYDPFRRKFKHALSFRIHIASTIFPQDRGMVSFLRSSLNDSSPKIDDSIDADSSASSLDNREVSAVTAVSFKETIVNVHKFDDDECFVFFFVLIKNMFRAMANVSDNIGAEAFFAIMMLLKKVSKFGETKGQSPVLKLFCTFLYENPDIGSGKLIFEQIVKHWSRCSGLQSLGSKNFWFLFRIIGRSIALHCWTNLKMLDDSLRRKVVTESFLEQLWSLIGMILCSRRSFRTWETLKCFPLFFNSICPFIDRGVILTLIHNYVLELDPKNTDTSLSTMKFSFLRVICNYENFVQMNNPKIYGLKSIRSVIGIERRFWKNHPLIGLLLYEVNIRLLRKEDIISSQAIQTVENLLFRHSVDPRYKDSEEYLSHISSMYFSIIIMTCDAFSNLKSFLAITLHQWLVCFLWVLRYLPRDLLRSWWLQETQKRHIAFLDVIAKCLEIFSNQPSFMEVYRIVANVIIDFAKNSYLDLIPDHHIVFFRLFNCLIALLQLVPRQPATRVKSWRSSVSSIQFLEHNENVFSSVFTLCDFVIDHFYGHLFEYKGNSYLDQLSYELLQLCNLDNEENRKEAADRLWSLFLKNYEICGNLSRCRIQSTLAVSRLVGQQKLLQSKALKKSLSSVVSRGVEYAKSGTNNKEFWLMLQESTQLLISLVDYNQKIQQTTDPETLSDLYYETSNGYCDSPDLRLTWLENLSSIHLENQCYEEAAQCKVHMAYLVALFLKACSKLPLDPDELSGLSPNLLSVMPLPDIRVGVESGQFVSNTWSFDSMMRFLFEAEGYYEQACHFEMAVEIYEFLARVYKKSRNYTKMNECLDKWRELGCTLVEKQGEVRIINRFYHVCFLGHLFEELNGKEFIYKRPPTCNLNIFQQKIRKICQAKVEDPEKDIVALTSQSNLDEYKNDPRKMYYRILSVEPYEEDGDNSSRLATWEKHFNSSRFICESPYVSAGEKLKELSDIAHQKKKKSIFFTERCFPYFKNRISVIDTQELIISPIENAIEAILCRTGKMRELLECNPPRLKPLQQQLQGSVSPMVNEGPLKICEIFLSEKGRVGKNPVHVRKLAKSMETFVTMCGFAVKLNKALIEAKMIKFQQMLEKNYEHLKETVKVMVESINLDGSSSYPSQDGDISQ